MRSAEMNGTWSWTIIPCVLEANNEKTASNTVMKENKIEKNGDAQHLHFIQASVQMIVTRLHIEPYLKNWTTAMAATTTITLKI